MTKTRHIALLIILCALLAPPAAWLRPTEAQSATPSQRFDLTSRTPMAALFVENVGQFAAPVRYQVWGAQSNLWLTDDGIWISSVAPRHQDNVPPGNPALIKLAFVDANPNPVIEPFQAFDTTISYFLGNDPAQWHAKVPVWAGVRYVELYPGVDLILSTHDGAWRGQLQADSQAALDAVRLQVEGAERVALVGDHLCLDTVAGQIQWPLFEATLPDPTAPLSAPSLQGNQITRPFAQPAPERDASVADRSEDLLFATYLGGGGTDRAYGIALDDAGQSYITGYTDSADFNGPGLEPSYLGGENAFVAKLSADGMQLLYVAFIGGNGSDKAYGLAVDQAEQVYVTGYTDSPDLAMTQGYDPTLNGVEDAFALKLSADGAALLYVTYLGGAGGDRGYGIAVDPQGRAYVGGRTDSPDFAAIHGPGFDTTHNGCADAFVVRLSPDGMHIDYATFIGGSDADRVYDIAVDDLGQAYITGQTASPDLASNTGASGYDTTHNGLSDGFAAKLSADGMEIAYLTYLGGSHYEESWGIDIDGLGQAYLTGYTYSSDFPAAYTSGYDHTLNGGADVFACKLSADGGSLRYATFIGGSDNEEGWDIAVDTLGQAYLTGHTSSADFPAIYHNSYDTTLDGRRDAFAIKLSAYGQRLEYATFLGGGGEEFGRGIAVDARGQAHLTGRTNWADAFHGPGYDTSFGGWWDAFVLKLYMRGDQAMASDMRIAIDKPVANETISGATTISGWALDLRSVRGTGVDHVSIWLDGAMGQGTHLGDITVFEARPDMAGLGPNFVQCGYHLVWNSETVRNGTHALYIYAHSPASDWSAPVVRPINVQNAACNLRLAIDAPTANATVRDTIHISGWALDLRSTIDAGVDKVAVWLDGPMGQGRHLGDITTMHQRPDMAAALGNHFMNSGYYLTWDTNHVANGAHTLYVYAYAAHCDAWSEPLLRTINVANSSCDLRLAADAPGYEAVVSGVVEISGWALDLRSANGSGVDQIGLWLDGPMGEGTHLSTVTSFYARMDLAALGANFVNSGYRCQWDSSTEADGAHVLYIYAHSPTCEWSEPLTRAFILANGN